MGRHVNHQDAQDRITTRFSKTAKYETLGERDPASLTLAEQFELARKRQAEKPKEEKPVQQKVRFTGQK